jgi:plastocyanin domain-containing protein
MKLFKHILGHLGLSPRNEGREIEILVKGGYRPNRIEVVQGERVALKFIRKESSGCSREIAFPALGIKQELPEGIPVVIPLSGLEAGDYEFHCGMDMIQGEVTVLPQS